MADATSQEIKKNPNKFLAESLLGRESGSDKYKEIAKKVREGIQEKPPETVLQNLKAEGMSPLKDAEIHASLDRIIDSDKDADGREIRRDGQKVRTGLNLAKFTEAQNNINRANMLLKDFRNHPQAERDAIYNNVRRMLHSAYPEAAAAMAAATTSAQKDAVLANIFSNPDFARTLHGKLEHILNTEKRNIPSELADKVTNAQRDFTQSDIDYKSKDREYNEVKSHLEEFDIHVAGGGGKQRELDSLLASKTALEDARRKHAQEVQRLEATEATRKQEYDEVLAGTKNIRLNNGTIIPAAHSLTDVEAARKRLEAVQKSLGIARENLEAQEKKLERITHLEEEKQQTLRELEEKEKARAVAEAERKAAQNRLSNAQIELDEARLGVHEENFIKSTQTVIEDSVREFLAKQVEKANDKTTDFLEESANNETEEKKKEFKQMLKERWHKKGNLNKRLVQKDLQALLKGEDALRDALGASDEMWKDEEMKREAIASLLGYRINMGSLPANEAWLIFNRYDKTLFEEAEAKKTEFNDWMKMAREQGWIKGPGLEGLKNFVKDHPLMLGIILLMLAGAGAQVLAPGWTLAKLGSGAAALGEKYVGSHLQGTSNPFS